MTLESAIYCSGVRKLAVGIASNEIPLPTHLKCLTHDVFSPDNGDLLTKMRRSYYDSISSNFQSA